MMNLQLDLIKFLLSPWSLGILGLCVGSFLNVVVHRLPLMMERQWWRDVGHQLADASSWQRTFAKPAPKWTTNAATELEAQLEKIGPLNLAHPHSRCPSCGHAIAWHENIPLVSWLRLRGRCSACKTRISVRYPLLELSTGVLFALVAWRFDNAPISLAWCAVVATLVALTAIDWDTTLLPDNLTLPLLWAGLVAASWGWTIALPNALAGAAVGYLSLWSIYWLFKLATGKEGMGYGDFKLLAALGAWLGWQAVLPILLMSSVIGAVVGIGLKMSGGLREGRYMPFGPFLAGGGLVVILAGQARVLGWIGQ